MISVSRPLQTKKTGVSVLYKPRVGDGAVTIMSQSIPEMSDPMIGLIDLQICEPSFLWDMISLPAMIQTLFRNVAKCRHFVQVIRKYKVR